MDNFCACLEYIFLCFGNINGSYIRVHYIPYNDLQKFYFDDFFEIIMLHFID